MATTINITKQADGTWQGSFTSTGTRTIVQVERQENAPLYLNISADNGGHNVIYQPPKDFKNQILLIDIAEGALVTIVSHSAVTKAQYIASELAYYTKAETDEKIAQIYSLEPVVVDTLPTASEDTMKKLYFVPKTGGGETGNVKEEYITVRTVASGSGTEADPYVYSYSWEKVGDTSTQIQTDWNQTNTSSADFIKNKPTLGTASALDVAASGDASTTQVVKGDDSRLSDARNAADVYSWAKEANKPSYDYSEINNTPTIPTVPANVSAFTNDAGYITQETDPTVPSWAKAQSKPSYDYSEIQNKPTLPTSEQLLPAVTSTDNGKILIVDNGAWAAAEVPVADSVLF